MANREFTLYQGEVGRTMVATLTDEDAAAVNLTGCTALLIITLPGVVESIADCGGAMTIDANPLLGKASYVFSAFDAALAKGDYDLMIQVTDGSGNVDKFPRQTKLVSGEVVARYGTLHVLESKTVTP